MKRSLGRSTCARNRRISGQGMTEYIIVVALIAIAAIGVTTIFGGNVRALFGAAATGLTGDTNVAVKTEKPNASTYQAKGLNKFAKDN